MNNRVLSAILRTVLCVLLLVIVSIFQASLGLRLSLFGMHIDLLPLIVAASGVVMGPSTGLVCGLAAGILYDASGTSVEGLYPMYYMVCGIASGMYGEHYQRHDVINVMLCSMGTITVLSLLRYLFYFQFVNDTSILIFARDIAARALLALILSPIVLLIVRKIKGKERHNPDQISTSPNV